MPHRRRTALLAVPLLGVGAGYCAALWPVFAGLGVAPGVQLALVVVAAALAAAPRAGGAISGAVDRVRHPSPHARRRVAAGVWMVATTYLAATAYYHARDLFPRIHDECSYAIGARMLARGALWMPQHALADFFDSFHLLVRPRYCSIYFPGTALINVPGVWAGLPWWVVPVMLAGGVVALSYRVAAELVDGVAGLLVALLVLSTTRFRTFSTMVMSQAPVALLGLLVVWAWLRWRRDRRARWALVAGVFSGWAAVTRPVDAAAFILPVILAVALDLWRKRPDVDHLQRRIGWPIVCTIAAALAGAAPFLALQMVFNVGVTGHWLKTPYVTYLEQNQPGSVFGSGRPAYALAAPSTTPAAPMDVTAPTLPKSQLPQKRIYYEQLVEDEARARGQGVVEWLGTRLAQTAAITLPSPLLLIPLPVALLALGHRRRWVVGAAVPLFVGLYLLNPFYLDHYAIPLATAAAFLAVAGARTVESAVTSPRLRRSVSAFVVLGTVAVCLPALPELNSGVRDEAYQTPLLDTVEQKLSGPLEEVRIPAVVLFRFYPGSIVHEEPVYNTDVAWPDDAPIVRAHDLGSRDEELFSYYGKRQPARTFYLFDRKDGSLTDLGPADRAGRRLRDLDAATSDRAR